MFSQEKQLQKAGKNSQQIQVGTVVVQGIDEKRVREIIKEMYEVVKRDFSSDAYELANERVNKFEERFVPKIMEIEGAMKMFADPSFQFLIRNANKTAASTEREADYDMLSELLIHRVKRNDDRKKRAGINRAVEIVDQISDEALVGLTVAFVVMNYVPINGNISEGLQVFDSLFEKLLIKDMPKGEEWIEHLELLDAVRISSFQTFKKFEEFCIKFLPGYARAGIKKESTNYEVATSLLKKEGLPKRLLVDNELMEGYVRIPVIDGERVHELSLGKVVYDGEKKIETSTPLNESQKKALDKIWNMYDKDADAKASEEFRRKLDEYDNLRALRQWWNDIPSHFSVTAVGKVLAHANAKRCDNSLPDLD